jgi:hypothetical protein
MPALFLILLLAGVASLRATDSTTSHAAFSFDGSDLPRRDFRRAVESAEETFFRVTRYPDSDAPPVHVLTGQPGSLPSLKIDALEGGGPAVTLVISPDQNDARSAPMLAAALLLREFYGNKAPVPGSKVPRYPDWLLHGLGELITAHPGDKAAERSDHPSSDMAAFLNERVPDPESVSLLRDYNVTAGGLVKAGLCDDAGRASFRAWVGHYDPESTAASQSPWVEGWDMQVVERRWVLGLQSSQQAGDSSPVRIFGAEETLRRYREMMTGFRNGGNSLSEFRKVQGEEYRLDDLSRKMAVLRLQASPLAIPLLDDTLSLLRESRRLSPEKIRKREERLHAEEGEVIKRTGEITDYMNWYEATRVERPSGLFEKYLATPPAAVRKGPLGRRVDAIEQRGW